MSKTINLPPISDEQVSYDLVWLTEHLTKSGITEEYAGGILGGQYGYGVEFENDTFMMHPFCWCDRDDCPWCWGCECADEATEYVVAGRKVDFQEWVDAYDDPNLRDKRDWQRVLKYLCDYCKGERESAPNFLHKPTGTRVSWYKYIGRDMEVDMRGDWREILTDCAKSLRPATYRCIWDGSSGFPEYEEFTSAKQARQFAAMWDDAGVEVVEIEGGE